jgi:starch synthase (maltosyl-transferring)
MTSMMPPAANADPRQAETGHAETGHAEMGHAEPGHAEPGHAEMGHAEMGHASGVRIYYLHPLLAGPPGGWPRQFARIAALGFTHVLVAPPFQPDASGGVFATVDHSTLHPALGGGDAAAALAAVARAARECGLRLLLDLLIGRPATDASASMTTPPDPRWPPDAGGRAPNWAPDWVSLLATWRDAGIAGYRCDAPQRTPPDLWRRLIAADRRAGGDSLFLAWSLGCSEAEAASLAGCGFDLAASASWAWNVRDGWLADDTRRAALVGTPLAMPELPFGARVTGPAAGRALTLAASFSPAWLMPMGFEFGAIAPLDPVRDGPAQWASLLESPPENRGAAVEEANALHASLAAAPTARVVSAAGQPVAMLLRDGDGGAVILANADNAAPAQIAGSRILSRADGLHLVGDMTPDATLALAPAAARVLPLHPLPPIAPAAGAISATAAEPGADAGRIAIEAITPLVEDGGLPVKRRVGEMVTVDADIVTDGHSMLAAAVQWRPAGGASCEEVRMTPLGNDRYRAAFPLGRLGSFQFTVIAWEDRYAAFRDELTKKHEAGLDVTLELEEGRLLLAEIAAEADQPGLADIAERLVQADSETRRALLLSADVERAVRATDPRPFLARSPEIRVDAERRAASFASWYELFPRSQSGDATRHGTFDDVIARLPAIAAMGFDVLYFPPIHPIGRTHRKGRNNALQAGPDDPGSPYAIGSAEGGHDALHPELGTISDFRRLVRAAAGHGLEIALDFAIQCSPDHPWLREHPEWFDWRPDGTIRYAENPPKKYEDIVNVDFYAEGARPGLWLALRDVVRFWALEGVRIFRVDNPHTKPFPFWQWLIDDIRGEFPDTMFLAEAFTRPKVMYRLAKVGFSQSYSYFTWRNTAAEFRAYLTELNTPPQSEFFRPNFFVNTPDINPVFLHESGRPGFLLRAALATTLSGLWGLYSGFELCEARALPGREEYLDSEKYQIRAWDWDRPGNIVAEITRLNMIRRANPALQSHLGVIFLDCDNDHILCFMKQSPDGDNMVITAICMDPHHAQSGVLRLVPAIWRFAGGPVLRLESLMSGESLDWHGDDQTIRLDPAALPFAIWRVRAPLES